MKTRRLGVHVSIAGGLPESLRRARALGCAAMQIFSHSPRSWALRDFSTSEVSEFRKLRAELDISPVVVHTSYLINLCASDDGLREKSFLMLVEEMRRADLMGADYVVHHAGTATGGTSPEEAMKKVSDALRRLSGVENWNVKLLIENTAGERGDIASTMEALGEIARSAPRIIGGVCMDTCHAFAAGYDFRTDKGMKILASEIKKHVGEGLVKVVHLNDSKGEAGGGRDRHEHIGEGRIGLKGFSAFLRNPVFSGAAAILETPKDSEEDDPRNLAVVRRLMRSGR